MDQISLRLKPLPPFRLDLTAWALRRRENNIIDRWDGFRYRRVLTIGGKPVGLEITPTGTADRPILRVTAAGNALEPKDKAAIRATLEKMFGLRLDLTPFYDFAERHRRLRDLVQRFRGLKPPRFPTVFEAVANAIACQQLSLTVGILLLSRLAEKYGAPFPMGGETLHSFPLPENLGKATPADLRKMGFSGQKARYLIDLAHTVNRDTAEFEGLPHLPDETVLSRLYELRGVGRWTAEYVLLRGLGRIHILPGDDVGARHRLENLLGLKEPLDYVGVSRIRERWRPYAGLIYFHLLLDGLAEQGYIKA